MRRIVGSVVGFAERAPCGWCCFAVLPVGPLVRTWRAHGRRPETAMFRAASDTVGTADGTWPLRPADPIPVLTLHLNGSGGDAAAGAGPEGAHRAGARPGGQMLSSGRNPSGAFEPPTGAPQRGVSTQRGATSVLVRKVRDVCGCQVDASLCGIRRKKNLRGVRKFPAGAHGLCANRSICARRSLGEWGEGGARCRGRAALPAFLTSEPNRLCHALRSCDSAAIDAKPWQSPRRLCHGTV